MKITKRQLKRIIKEELESLYEDEDDDARALELAREADPYAQHDVGGVSGLGGEDDWYDDWLDDVTAPTPEEDVERAHHEVATQDLTRDDWRDTWVPQPTIPKQAADEGYNVQQTAREIAEKLSYLDPIARLKKLQRFLKEL